MDLASALLKRLDDDEAITGVVGTRKHWVTRNQGDPLPAIVLQVVSEERSQDLDGFDDMRTARVQVAALALSYGEARQLLEKAIAALVVEATVDTVQFWEASLDGPRDTAEDLDGVGLVHRPIADLIIRYSLDS